MRVETIVKDNAILLDLLEEIKGMDGVNNVIWSEIVKIVGQKNLFPWQLLTNSNLLYNKELVKENLRVSESY